MEWILLGLLFKNKKSHPWKESPIVESSHSQLSTLLMNICQECTAYTWKHNTIIQYYYIVRKWKNRQILVRKSSENEKIVINRQKIKKIVTKSSKNKKIVRNRQQIVRKSSEIVRNPKIVKETSKNKKSKKIVINRHKSSEHKKSKKIVRKSS
jgi:hypothetical protein